MARVTIVLPSLLTDVVGGGGEIEVEGDDLVDAMNALFDKTPALRRLVFDESSWFREHVLCFVNDKNSRWSNDRRIPLRDGDCITIMQAVSGG